MTGMTLICRTRVICVCSHFKRYMNITLEFLPQVLFLLFLFGWLVFMIVYKWCAFYTNPNYVSRSLVRVVGRWGEQFVLYMW